MNDQHDEMPPEIRRIGKKDRKSRIKEAGGLFDEVSTTSPPPLAPPDPVEPALADRFPPVDPRPVKRSAKKRAPKAKSTAPMATQRRNPAQTARHNQIAALFFLATLGVIAYFVYIWQQPYSALNPFPPPVDVIIVTATPQGVERFRGVVTTSTDENACDAVIVGGAVRTNTPEVFAVRVSGALLDEGVLTGAVAEYGEYAYQFRLPVGAGQYSVELYDTSEHLLAAPVVIQTQDACQLNRIQVDFEP